MPARLPSSPARSARVHSTRCRTHRRVDRSDRHRDRGAPRRGVRRDRRALPRSHTRAMGDKLEVLERGSDLALAAHRTTIGPRWVATTVEPCGPAPGVDRLPARSRSRAVPRGTVHVHRARQCDTAVLERRARHRLLEGRSRVGQPRRPEWERTVRASLDGIRHEAERRHATRR